jgi:hypothetical protein
VAHPYSQQRYAQPPSEQATADPFLNPATTNPPTPIVLPRDSLIADHYIDIPRLYLHVKEISKISYGYITFLAYPSTKEHIKAPVKTSLSLLHN